MGGDIDPRGGGGDDDVGVPGHKVHPGGSRGRGEKRS